MRKIIILILFLASLFASQNDLKNMSLLQLFNNKYYSYICDKRWIFINKYNNKREDLLSLVAYACLKKRYLTPALDLAKVLKVTKEGRKNATYIVTLFLMKKLIMQIIDDDLKIGNIKLPQITDNSLGKAFGLIENGSFKREKNTLEINVSKNTVYKVWISHNNNVVIDTISNGELKNREYYW
ncbi:hypothetical protein C3L23_05890 [Nautilia sp. PV-1]|uniref:hypothetical protein n=1 Tax=Nautilia sp. PV-1 TaxID=2579250 RepID=UPI000FDBEEE2|nr:hypothetical protein [Nautilia sp. PV-1]AZV46819.1 hypothetical protein C3L23_05890 [Nautilia sp. PV-1]